MKILDKAPPVPTGNLEQDNKAMNDWLHYLYEQLNWNISLQNRENGGNANGSLHE